MPERLFSKIVVATDFSPEARLAAVHAARLARGVKGQLIVLHVLAPVDQELGALTGADYLEQYERDRRAEAYAGLEKLAAEFGPEGLECRTLVLEGRVPDVLDKLVGEEKPSLLAIGAHGAGGSRGSRMGTVAVAVIRRVHCPVLMVRPPHADRFGKILLALDPELPATPLLDYTKSVAKAEGGSIHPLHVFHYPQVGANVPGGLAEFEKSYRKTQEKKARGFFEKASEPELAQNVELVEGKAIPETLVAAASRLGAQLIVFGTHDRGRLGEWFLGSIAKECAALAPMSVLVVRPVPS